MSDPVLIAGVAFAAGLWASVPIRRVCEWIDRKFFRHPCDADWECPECGHEENDERQ